MFLQNALTGGAQAAVTAEQQRPASGLDHPQKWGSLVGRWAPGLAVSPKAHWLLTAAFQGPSPPAPVLGEMGPRQGRSLSEAGKDGRNPLGRNHDS